jgi:threonine dehydratase
MNTQIKTEDIYQAAERLKEVAIETPLQINKNLSELYKANIFIKREDLQVVRSYKIRGAYNKMASMNKDELIKGVVCASAGNHAQGVAYACQKMGVKGSIFMPSTTPAQKVRQVKMFGKEWVDIILAGDTFDDSFEAAQKFNIEQGGVFVHPFDDLQVIAGQGTVGLEILNQIDMPIDYLLFAIGGGGLASGVSTLFKHLSPETILLGVEPEGSPTLNVSIENDCVTPLEHIDKFVDGAAVKKAGDITFEIVKENLDDILLVPEGKVCTTILKLYNEEAIIVEPAGALSIAALDYIKEDIKGKNVVCIIGGGNNDITRTEEIKERSLIFEGLKHYFIVRFPQRSGALNEFLGKVLGDSTDIVFFEYSKKTAREKGPALIGLEIQKREEFEPLLKRMKEHNVQFTYINDKPDLFEFLI